MRGVLTAAVLVGATGSSLIAQAPGNTASGQPLALHASCAGQGLTATLQIELQNTGTTELSIVPGYTPAGTQNRVVNSLTVAVIRIATGATEEYFYISPKYAAFTGRSDPWVVPLTPGAKYSVELPLKDFISGMSYSPLEPGVVAGGRLVFESKATKTTPRAWSGKIETAIQPCT